jgi:hypothetical protein
MLWILKGIEIVKNIYYMNVRYDLEHQQMCRSKKEKSCTIDAKTKQYQIHTKMERCLLLSLW